MVGNNFSATLAMDSINPEYLTPPHLPQPQMCTAPSSSHGVIRRRSSVLVTRRGSAGGILPLGGSNDDGLVNVMRRKSSTSFVTVMDEEFHFPTTMIPDMNSVNFADAYMSARQLEKKSSTDGLFSNVLFKSNSDSPQFSPTPPFSPMLRRSSVVMITRSTSCPELSAKSDSPVSPPPIITRLPSWDDVREQFNHAHAVAVHSGLGEDVVIRERSAFLSAWTLHSLSSTFRLNQSA